MSVLLFSSTSSLDLTRPLKFKLDSKEIDLVKAREEIERSKSALIDIQDHIDERHRLLYTEAVELAGSIQIDLTIPSIVNRQIHRANAPAAAPHQYYKINLSRVFLDHAIRQLDIRFQDQVHMCYNKGFHQFFLNLSPRLEKHCKTVL